MTTKCATVRHEWHVDDEEPPLARKGVLATAPACMIIGNTYTRGNQNTTVSIGPNLYATSADPSLPRSGHALVDALPQMASRSATSAEYKFSG
jgi:hypothetical protein